MYKSHVTVLNNIPYQLALGHWQYLAINFLAKCNFWENIANNSWNTAIKVCHSAKGS